MSDTPEARVAPDLAAGGSAGAGLPETKHITPTRDADEMRRLYALFGDAAETVPEAEAVQTPEVPEPFRTLLSHERHMTVTLEAFLGSPVNVQALETRRDGDDYARKILLTDSRTGSVVQFGIMRFNLALVDARTRDRIVEAKIPLGRILIEHGVMRSISTHALLIIHPDAAMRHAFNMNGSTNGAASVAAADEPVYGRLATIFCDGEPAVELLEVLPPGLTEIHETRAAQGKNGSKKEEAQ